MPVEQQLTQIFEVIEGGAQTTAEIIQFPSDAGATALEGISETVSLGNGTATTVSQLTVIEGGATKTAGVGLLSMDVGAVGLAIAPALGILAGVGLYNLAPEFWTNVSNALVQAGETIGGKVRTFLNSDTQTVGVSERTLEIFKQAFINEGLFITGENYNIDTQTNQLTLVNVDGSTAISQITSFVNSYSFLDSTHVDALYSYMSSHLEDATKFAISLYYQHNNPQSHYDLRLLKVHNTNPFNVSATISVRPSWWSDTSLLREIGNATNTFAETLSHWSKGSLNTGFGTTLPFAIDSPSYIFKSDDYALSSITNSNDYCVPQLTNVTVNDNLQEGATYPTEDPISTTYPTWLPWELPSELPTIYPIEIPAQNPASVQDTSQNPDPLPSTQSIIDFLIDNLPQPQPEPEPTPEPVPDPDPDPQPEPDPIPEPDPTETDPDPVDPNPDPTPSPLPIVPDIPDSVPANAMFTVYKPTQAQINAFGGWLWSSSIMEAIKRIWQNPLDGIISFMKVYADPTTSSTDTIKVGMLDSEVSAGVVSGQFVTVECGELDIKEKFYNATDYSPFTSLHLYLPFIGIVELDVDEFMSGKIKVTYHIDVYTGTCLAEVKTKRSPDMPNYTIVYSFSGNASQQLPLTSAEFGGAISSLVSAVGGGLAIASGGGLGLLAGASGMAHAVTHEMVHLAHSGSMSANAGIMGARKPFLIITRHKPYDANGYNQIYGYPSNKTVYLNNCSGFVRVKEIQLSTGATTEENNEIISLLKGGIII